MPYEKLGVGEITIAVNTHQSLGTYKISVWKSEGKTNWNSVTGGRMLLKLILYEQNMKIWTQFNWPLQSSV